MKTTDESTALALAQAAEVLVAEPSRGRVLARVAELALRALPAADHASITLSGPVGLHTAAATGPVPRQIDALQYELDEGPCVSATRTGAVVLVPNVSEDPRWPRFNARLPGGRGAPGSMLAVPLQTGGQVTGSLNLAAEGKGAFRDATSASAVVFAAIAGLALTAAVAIEDATTRTARVQELEDFTAVLGHDLRSGMTGALAALNVVARRRNQLDPAGRQAVDLLTEELSSQMRLLVDLLHLAQDRAGDPAGHGVPLLPPVHQALEQRREPIPLDVHADARRALVGLPAVRLRRILANLLDNASRHGGGATAVAVGRDGDQVWVSVDDAGPGVPPEQRAYVFTRFWTRTGLSSESAGLGLALSREHARSVGGELTVEDSPDGGARFVLALPVVDPSPPSA